MYNSNLGSFFCGVFVCLCACFSAALITSLELKWQQGLVSKQELHASCVQVCAGGCPCASIYQGHHGTSCRWLRVHSYRAGTISYSFLWPIIFFIRHFLLFSPIFLPTQCHSAELHEAWTKPGERSWSCILIRCLVMPVTPWILLKWQCNL